MKKVVKKAVKITLDLLTYAIFALLLFVAVIKFDTILKKDNKYVSLLGYSIFNVATGSMSPAINQDDIILVKSHKDYYIDDIITYKKGDDFITHRIIDINENGFVTKGDGNNAIDGTIKKEIVIGKVVKIFVRAGIWQKILTTPSVVVMIFVTLLLFDLAFSYKGKEEKKAKEKLSKVSNKKIREARKYDDAPELSEEEIINLYNKLEKSKQDKDVILKRKEEEFVDYTIRLDLKEIQKEINIKMREGDKDDS